MSEPTTHFLRGIKLVKVGVHLARLQVKHLTAREVNLFRPLKRGADAVFHVVIADIDKDLKAS